MSGERNYGGVIWTNHALERLGQRGLTQEIAWQAFQHPDEERVGKTSDSMEYHRRIGKSEVTVVAKQNEKREWLILSCWAYPPLTAWAQTKEDDYHKFKRAGFWGKMWYTLKKQLFG